MMTSLNYDKNNVWHVTPVNDLKEHQDNIKCPCNPKIEILDNGGMVVTHKAYDNRELFEPINTKEE